MYSQWFCMTSGSQDNAYNAASFIRLSKAGKKKQKTVHNLPSSLFFRSFFHSFFSTNEEVFFLV